MFPDPLHRPYSAWSEAAAQETFLGGWQFDFISFALGLLIALSLVALVYRYRAHLAQYRDQAQTRANQLRQRLTANTATRYTNNVIKDAQTRHLFSGFAAFDDIYVETQLNAPLVSTEEAADKPFLSPVQAVQASDQLCIMGESGSGRTTVLNYLLLFYARKVAATPGNERVPVYIYLPVLAAELVTDPEKQSDEGAAAVHLLVRAALSSSSRLTTRGVARWLQRQTSAGNALILLDGWDEVPKTNRAAVTAWVRRLFSANPGNRLVVTAGEHGYAPLMEAGFVPLKPVRWTQLKLTDLSRKWSTAWPGDARETDSSVPILSYGLTPPTPLEATIRLVIQLCGRKPARSPAGKMTQVMELLLPTPEPDDDGHVAWPVEVGYRALGRLALSVFEHGQPTIERAKIQSTVTAAMARTESALDREDEATEREPKTTREDEERRTLQIVDCCRDLTATGAPIRTWDRQTYSFAHPQLAAYLAARYVTIEGASALAHVDDPDWSDVLRFYAGLASAAPLIDRLLSSPDDLVLNRLWKAAALLAASPQDRAPGRLKLMKRLAQLVMNPRLPSLLRNRALQALVESGEAGVVQLFRTMAENPNPRLRADAILGLGPLGNEKDIPLLEAALGDDRPEVRLAAINALRILARLGNEKALELIIGAVIVAEDWVQRVAVEALAELEREGHAVLRDAAKDEDLIVRRAAVHGLTAVDQPWARELLETVQQDDDEWLVRNAAAEALASMRAKDDEDMPPLDLTLPLAETESWLIAWAAAQGEGTGVGDAALYTLTRAMSEGDASVRRRAAETMGRLADPRTIDDLRQTLRDPEPSVRDAALTALEEISRRYDKSIATS